ncbi:hypothetical protein [Novosphingobium ginsenosidimutans]|uniref:Uncharacterized protein n=1 Tax=Novosphingobium ginsenosidimutans TaxID=1176536 RepID=A0A5B8S3F7_9SPHN|nr:hypothetical protein [Novosphingobium ginsenosidimutans]QEA15843.1 hypothetical protein FRF71_06630 [Novosphingobium ginsenosidimutans]
MEFGKDLISSLRDRVLPGSEGASAGRCDWAAISARLQAAHAARVELIRAEIQNLRLLGGSFGSQSGLTLVGGNHASHEINPSDLADGKAPVGNAVSAGTNRLGDG